MNQVVGMFTVNMKIDGIYLVPGLGSGHMAEMPLCDQQPLRTWSTRLKLAFLGEDHLTHTPPVHSWKERCVCATLS